MATKPILFSGPMVRALLAGRKTQTRRLLKVQPDPGMTPDTKLDNLLICRNIPHGLRQDIPIPYAAGDLLWVREAWRSTVAYDDLRPSEMGGEESIRYGADGRWQTWGWQDYGRKGRGRSSLHMPRWASRLTLRVTDVRVQRLQEISEADAQAEGMTFPEGMEYGCNPIGAFRALWDSLNAARAPWDDNPWVAAYTFTVHECNVDQMEAAG